MTRGKAPRRGRPRADDVRAKLHNVRLAHKRVLIARGHLAHARTAEKDAARAAFKAGATHREIIEAQGRPWAAGRMAHDVYARRR